MSTRTAATQSSGRKHKPDYLLLLSIGVLLLLGLVIIYSISPVLSHKIIEDAGRNHFLFGQLLHIGLGLAAFFVAANMRYQQWRRLLPGLIILSAFTLLLLMIPGVGVEKNGAVRWIEIAGVSFQPSELIKLTLVVYVAQRFSRLRKQAVNDSSQMLWPTVVMLLVVSFFIVFLQRDLGTMVVMSSIIVGLFYASGVSLKQVGTLLGIGAGLGLASIAMFPHRIARVVTFLNPDQGVTSSSYHINQALIAIGSGGIFGLGLGKSIQVYGYLPEAANDSIFAIIAETFGFVGSLIVLAAFALLLYRGFLIALRSPDRFGQLMALGIVLWIGSQTIINMGAMLGVIPLTGIPLPFLSYGGSSLLFVMIAAGILVNISKHTQRGLYEGSTLRGRNRRSRHTGTRHRPASANANQ